ncbi:GIY-YIG nuclease family protein [Aquabacterium sp.]|uniref:GIY-YIG nuclease family protein n=1 Tax=Aquabacterium sp. TaxID=1872578 RepID=UPI0035B0041A
MEAVEAKASLQAAIDSCQIASMRQLLDRVAADKLEVTRNGRDYLGLRGNDGRRFRVHFSFVNESRTQKPALPAPPLPESKAVCDVRRTGGYWIYALTARSSDGERKACYIGQTVNLKRRFREHLRRHRPGHASSALTEWAAREQVEVRATVLTWVDGDQSYASRFEGYWLKLAVEAGYAAPDAHNWGRLPLPSVPVGQPSQWPTSEILAASLPLPELVERGLTPVELFVASRVPF